MTRIEITGLQSYCNKTGAVFNTLNGDLRLASGKVITNIEKQKLAAAFTPSVLDVGLALRTLPCGIYVLLNIDHFKASIILQASTDG